MTNEQMKPGRFGRWCAARKRVTWIKDRLAEGKTVVVATQLKATKFDKRHIDLFKATQNGAYAKYGKTWLCIDGCGLRAY